MWSAASVCFLVALALAVLGNGTPAIAALAIGLIMTLVAITHRWISTPRGIALGESRRFGKGPYVKIECPVNAAFIEKLAALVQQLRAATEDHDWTVDVKGFNAHCEAAEKNGQQGQYEAALRDYIHAISFMMSELRKQGRRGNGRPPRPFGI